MTIFCKYLFQLLHYRSCRIGPLVPCDYCPLFFHLDCLDPPLTTPPTGKWMCPNHPEHFMVMHCYWICYYTALNSSPHYLSLNFWEQEFYSLSPLPLSCYLWFNQHKKRGREIFAVYISVFIDLKYFFTLMECLLSFFFRTQHFWHLIVWVKE